MSLINDALKRANTQKAPPPGAVPEDGARMLPAVREEPAGSNPLLLYVGIALIVLAVGVFALSFGLRDRPTESTQAKTSLTVASNVSLSAPLTQIAAAPTPAIPEPAAPTSEQIDRARATIVQTETKASSPVVASPTPAILAAAPAAVSAPQPSVAAAPAAQTPAVTAPPSFPAFKLQAIYYRMKGPTVVIDGRTLRVGDRISEARVLAIERMRVEMEWRGERRWFSLQ
jgi:hypothetical protein